MWELDHKESWVPKYWCFWTVLEKTFESPLDSKETKSVNPKRNKPWISIGRTDAEAEAPILWSPDAKSRLTGKDPDEWEPEEKGTTEDEMTGRHHWFNEHELGQILGDNEGQGSLMCFPGSQRIRHDLVTKQQLTKSAFYYNFLINDKWIQKWYPLLLHKVTFMGFISINMYIYRSYIYI